VDAAALAVELPVVERAAKSALARDPAAVREVSAEVGAVGVDDPGRAILVPERD
jgi:ABC-type phosphate transport system permease subunit